MNTEQQPVERSPSASSHPRRFSSRTREVRASLVGFHGDTILGRSVTNFRGDLSFYRIVTKHEQVAPAAHVPNILPDTFCERGQRSRTRLHEGAQRKAFPSPHICSSNYLNDGCWRAGGVRRSGVRRGARVRTRQYNLPLESQLASRRPSKTDQASSE